MRKVDADVIKDGRKNPLKDSEEVQVVVPLRDQVINKLVKKLEDLEEGKRTVELWKQGNAERGEWLKRMQMLTETFDEFIDPIYTASHEWASTLHLPVVFTVCKTFHARMLAALLGIDPPLNVRARQSHNVDRAPLIQELMRYTLVDWINNHKGIEEEIDAWLWAWITQGSSFLKQRWDRKFTRFIDVQTEQKLVGNVVAPDENGNAVAIPQYQEVEVEKEVTITTFDGPSLKWRPCEDILLIGGSGDPDEADSVLESDYLTASELWQLADQRVFRKEAVEKVISWGENLRSANEASGIKQQQAATAGKASIDTTLDADRYHVIERYARIDVDGSGIASEVILWVHGVTGEILRATYLYRVNKTGLRPYAKIDFHKRFGQDNGVGLPELLYSLQREIDACHNMKVDFGIISSMPFGFYRSTSSLSTEKMPLEPGVMIPLDNPQTDVFFPQLGSRTGFTVQEEQALYQQIERMTSISDMNLGIVGGQGAARTATGARALLGESNANLDVYLRRMNRGWKRALVYLFHSLQERLPEGFQFRVLGDDGQGYWAQIKTKEEIAGAYDFELEANSANSNKQIQIEQANSVLASIANPFFIQMGIVGPANIYNALKTKLVVEGVKDFSRYITKPTGALRIYTPEELANATLAGVELPLGPEQDLQGFITYVQYIIDHDELLGQFNQDQAVALARKAQEAQAMLEASQAQAAQVANAQQIATNSSMATPSPQGAGQAQAMAPEQAG